MRVMDHLWLCVKKSTSLMTLEKPQHESLKIFYLIQAVMETQLLIFLKCIKVIQN